MRFVLTGDRSFFVFQLFLIKNSIIHLSAGTNFESTYLTNFETLFCSVFLHITVLYCRLYTVIYMCIIIALPIKEDYFL